MSIRDKTQLRVERVGTCVAIVAGTKLQVASLRCSYKLNEIPNAVVTVNAGVIPVGNRDILDTGMDAFTLYDTVIANRMNNPCRCTIELYGDDEDVLFEGLVIDAQLYWGSAEAKTRTVQLTVVWDVVAMQISPFNDFRYCSRNYYNNTVSDVSVVPMGLVDAGSGEYEKDDEFIAAVQSDASVQALMSMERINVAYMLEVLLDAILRKSMLSTSEDGETADLSARIASNFSRYFSSDLEICLSGLAVSGSSTLEGVNEALISTVINGLVVGMMTGTMLSAVMSVLMSANLGLCAAPDMTTGKMDIRINSAWEKRYDTDVYITDEFVNFSEGGYRLDAALNAPTILQVSMYNENGLFTKESKDSDNAVEIIGKFSPYGADGSGGSVLRVKSMLAPEWCSVAYQLMLNDGENSASRKKVGELRQDSPEEALGDEDYSDAGADSTEKAQGFADSIARMLYSMCYVSTSTTALGVYPPMLLCRNSKYYDDRIAPCIGKLFNIISSPEEASDVGVAGGNGTANAYTKGRLSGIAITYSLSRESTRLRCTLSFDGVHPMGESSMLFNMPLYNTTGADDGNNTESEGTTNA